MGNINLNKAKSVKNDEFYTQISDIEKEMEHYKHHFKDKVVFCNCDDPESSNFWKYFSLNFEHLGLKKLVSTHFKSDDKTYKLEISRDVNGDGRVNWEDLEKITLEGNGDFRSPESIEILKEADIVVTNPPFSLFREYIAQLMEHDKKFLILGNGASTTYKETFEMIRKRDIWLGHHANVSMEFELPDSYERWTRMGEDGTKYGTVPGISWFTNLDHAKRHEDMILYRKYYGNESNYPRYDNYQDAINIDKLKDIPMDYDGLMGVPSSILAKINHEQFEIVDMDRVLVKELTGRVSRFYLGGKEKFARIVIRNKKLIK